MMETSAPLTKTQLKAWTKLVLKKFPEEAVAYVVDGKIMPVTNVHPEPMQHFSVSVMDRFKANEGVISGFLHSHCGTPRENANRLVPSDWPSYADVKGWMADDTRWGISACDGENVTPPIWLDENHIAPLDGREFIVGIWDCYTAIRDWYRINMGVTLKNFARGVDHWVDKNPLYDKHFAEAGFVEVPPEQAQYGDVLLIAVKSDFAMHGAIYINDTTMYHQLNSTTVQALSGPTDISRWLPHVLKVIRYEGKLNA